MTRTTVSLLYLLIVIWSFVHRVLQMEEIFFTTSSQKRKKLREKRIMKKESGDLLWICMSSSNKFQISSHKPWINCMSRKRSRMLRILLWLDSSILDSAMTINKYGCRINRIKVAVEIPSRKIAGRETLVLLFIHVRRKGSFSQRISKDKRSRGELS